MCLVTRQFKAETTTKDLYVYKLLSVCYNSEGQTIYRSRIHSSFHWTPDKLEKTEFRIDELEHAYDAEFYDGKAFGAFQSKHPDWWTEPCIQIGPGFHACLTRKRFYGSYSYESNKNIFRFKIPKGSKVYKDTTGQIVSNKIMFCPTVKERRRK